MDKRRSYDEKEHINELINNAAFIQQKLIETRNAMEKMPIVMPYDNGGGQTGIRENPAFPAYEKLLKSYQNTISQIRDLVEKKPILHTQSSQKYVIGQSRWSNGNSDLKKRA